MIKSVVINNSSVEICNIVLSRGLTRVMFEKYIEMKNSFADTYKVVMCSIVVS